MPVYNSIDVQTDPAGGNPAGFLYVSAASQSPMVRSRTRGLRRAPIIEGPLGLRWRAKPTRAGGDFPLLDVSAASQSPMVRSRTRGLRRAPIIEGPLGLRWRPRCVAMCIWQCYNTVSDAAAGSAREGQSGILAHLNRCYPEMKQRRRIHVWYKSKENYDK